MWAIVVLGGALSACTWSGGAESESDDSQPSPTIMVDEPSSPLFGSEAVGATGRPVTYVKIWNDELSPAGVEVGGGTVVPIEVVDADGNPVGFLSTCFPADICGSTLADLAEGCVRLSDGTEDCLVESSVGTRHVVHVMDGPVSVAEVRAAVDLAESGSS